MTEQPQLTVPETTPAPYEAKSSGSITIDLVDSSGFAFATLRARCHAIWQTLSPDAKNDARAELDYTAQLLAASPSMRNALLAMVAATADACRHREGVQSINITPLVEAYEACREALIESGVPARCLTPVAEMPKEAP